MRIAKRRGVMIARVAAARKLLGLIFYGLRDGEIRCLAREASGARFGHSQGASSKIDVAPSGEAGELSAAPPGCGRNTPCTNPRDEGMSGSRTPRLAPPQFWAPLVRSPLCPALGNQEPCRGSISSLATN